MNALSSHNENAGGFCEMMFVKTYPFQLLLNSCLQISQNNDANACYKHKHTDYYGGKE